MIEHYERQAARQMFSCQDSDIVPATGGGWTYITPDGDTAPGNWPTILKAAAARQRAYSKG